MAAICARSQSDRESAFVRGGWQRALLLSLASLSGCAHLRCRARTSGHDGHLLLLLAFLSPRETAISRGYNPRELEQGEASAHTFALCEATAVRRSAPIYRRQHRRRNSNQGRHNPQMQPRPPPVERGASRNHGLHKSWRELSAQGSLVVMLLRGAILFPAN